MKWNRSASRFLVLSLLATTPLAASPLVGGNLWIVAEDGSGDFDQVQPAIDAAGDGDVVLVREGRYNGFAVEAKGLSIVGDGAVVIESGQSEAPNQPAIAIHLRDSGPEQLVVVRGLDVGDGVRVEAALLVEDCAGPVWIEDCVLGNQSDVDPRGVAAVSDSPQVLIDDCVLGGEPLALETARSGVAARMSSVFVYDSELVAVDGPFAYATGAAWGWHSELFVAGSALAGADGVVIVEYCIPSPGGAGVNLLGSTVYSVDNSISAGQGGCMTEADCHVDYCSDDGAVYVSPDDSPLVELEGTSMSLSADAITVAGRPLTLTLEGAAPGALAVLLATAHPVYSAAPDISSAFLALTSSTVALPLGVADGSGFAQAVLTAPSPGPGALAATVVGQAVTLALPGVVRASSGSAITIVAGD